MIEAFTRVVEYPRRRVAEGGSLEWDFVANSAGPSLDGWLIEIGFHPDSGGFLRGQLNASFGYGSDGATLRRIEAAELGGTIQLFFPADTVLLRPEFFGPPGGEGFAFANGRRCSFDKLPANVGRYMAQHESFNLDAITGLATINSPLGATAFRVGRGAAVAGAATVLVSTNGEGSQVYVFNAALSSTEALYGRWCGVPAPSNTVLDFAGVAGSAWSVDWQYDLWNSVGEP